MKKELVIEMLRQCHKTSSRKDGEYWRGFNDAVLMAITKVSLIEVRESLLKDIYANLLKI